MKTETDESKYFVAPHRLVEIEEERKHIENIFFMPDLTTSFCFLPSF